MDGGNQIPLRLWDFLQNFLINCAIKQYRRQMHPPLPQKGWEEGSYKLFSDRLSRVVLMFKKNKTNNAILFVGSTDSREICLKGMILVSLRQIQVLFYLHTRLQNGAVRAAQTEIIRILLNNIFLNKACILRLLETSNSHISGPTKRDCRGGLAVSIHTNQPFMSHGGGLHWLFAQTESCDFREEHHENEASDVCFSYFSMEGKQSVVL